MSRAFFQTGEFLGYYDLTLTATRAWNDIGQFKFRCKFNSKKKIIYKGSSIFIK